MLEMFSVWQTVLICNTHGKTVAEKVSEKDCPRNVVSKKRTKCRRNSERHAQGLTIIKHENVMF